MKKKVIPIRLKEKAKFKRSIMGDRNSFINHSYNGNENMAAS